MPPDSTDTSLRNELEQLAVAGLPSGLDLNLPILRRIGQRAQRPEEHATESALRQVLNKMGDTPLGRAAKQLTGYSPEVRGARLGARQVAAAEQIPISPRQFRRPDSWQARVIDGLASAADMLLTGTPGQADRPAAIPHELAEKLVIRPTVANDRDFVIKSIEDALAPYYGGNHRAHAERILDAHLQGGFDRLGFFSLEQRMFVATLGDEPDAPRLGLIHLVGKRQQTYKISPLIVAPEARRLLHVGTRLLKHAQHYADDKGGRSIYCTVAEDNKAALQFFVRSGFVIAGLSDSHYKPGATELMLYKLLSASHTVKVFDVPNISVTAFEPRHEHQVRDLLLAHLPEHFEGIDDTWVDALFAGYKRRQSRDVNLKYKLLFVATDRSGNVLGVAAATPKKGEPIKLMPLVAPTAPAFLALITDLPFQLREYGRKVYAHLTPSPEETVALQSRGWKLDAALPAAYHAERVTQQWSIDIESEDFMRTMRVKQRYLDYIKARTKPLEVRVGYDSIRTIRKGERIRFASRDDSQVVLVRDVRKYQTFADMAGMENLAHIVPGQSHAAVLKTLREIYPPDRERLGVVVLDIEPAAS